MHISRVLLTIIVCMPIFITATLPKEPEEITFFQLSEVTGKNHLPQDVQIRGFLYETAEGIQILAAEPNLKSCCVGSDTNRSKQIALARNIDQPPDHRLPVTLKGTLRNDNPGHFTLILENAEIIHREEGSNSIYLWIFGAILCGVVMFLLRHSTKKI